MSAGQAIRRQNFSFMTVTPPVASDSASETATYAMHYARIVLAVVSAAALELGTFATVSMLVTGR